jgi:hypothetical protein
MFKVAKQIYFFSTNVDKSAAWYEALLDIPQDTVEAIPEKFALIRLGEIELCFHSADPGPIRQRLWH